MAQSLINGAYYYITVEVNTKFHNYRKNPGLSRFKYSGILFEKYSVSLFIYLVKVNSFHVLEEFDREKKLFTFLLKGTSHF
jgi:hypothetical protein